MAYEKNNLERQLIAVCGVVDDMGRFGTLAISPVEDVEGAVSIKLSNSPEEFLPWQKTFVVRFNGMIQVREVGGFRSQSIEKSWKDYPKFAEISK